MKSILCALGIHTPSRFEHYRGWKIRGNHKYRVTYACCKRCHKILNRITWKEKSNG